MGYPTPYQTQGPALIGTYSYTDLADGTGQALWYGTGVYNDAAASYALTTQAITAPTDNAGVLLNKMNSNNDYQLDTPTFNTPRTVRGTGHFSCVFVCSSSSKNMYVNAQIKHVDSDGTETNLTSNIKSQVISGTATGDKYISFKMPITTEKRFKVGEFLRLKLQVRDGDAASYITTETTKPIKLFVPLKIDLT